MKNAMNFGNHFGTGGQCQRDVAWLLAYPVTKSDTDLGPQGGPLDAPEYMPAGSVNSLEYHGWDDQPLAAATMVGRA